MLLLLTSPSQPLQQQLHQLLIDILIDVDLRREEDRSGIGYRQIAAAHSKRQQVLWHFGDLEQKRVLCLWPAAFALLTRWARGP